jgi:ATP-dependent Clp protease ATP-binding subunit ClpB
MQAVRTAFRPEFLNRLDDILIFHKLTRGNMGKIVDIQLSRLQKRLADRKIIIQLDDKAKQWLAEAGYDPMYGARPLKRVMQRTLMDPLASKLLKGDVSDGQIITITATEEGLTF